MIKVFVVARIRLYRECLERHLASSPPMVISGSAAEPVQARQLMSDLQPNVLLLDLGTDNGPAFIQEVRAATPGTKVIGLANTETTADVIACIEAGMLGYLTTDATLPELVTAIRRADRGEPTCPAHTTAQVFGRLAHWAAANPAAPASFGALTARELEILRLVDQGLTNKEIARTLSISVSTVKNHIHHLLRKLGVKGRAEAAVLLRRRWPVFTGGMSGGLTSITMERAG